MIGRATEDAPTRGPARLVNLGVTRPQALILGHPARSQLVYAPRRFGKSIAAQVRAWLVCSKPNRHGLFWYLAPTYRQCRTPFLNLLRGFMEAGLVRSFSRAEMRIELATGWRIEFRSLEVADNARGEGPDAVVMDEADLIPDDDWYEAIYPAMADKRAPLLAITTPRKGRAGWFHAMHRAGSDGADPNKKGWHFDCYAATFLTREVLDEARRTMPERAFRQEFLAEPLDSAGAVYVDIRRRPRLTPLPGEPVGIGVDWAKKIDRTWFVAVGAESGAILKAQKVPQRLPYLRQVELLAEFMREYLDRTYYVVHDRTGVGEGVDEMLLAYYDTATRGRPFDPDHCEGFKFTEQSKRDLVEESVVDFEAGRIGWVPGAERDPVFDEMMREYQDYSLEITERGRVTYGAPPGLHDDAVMAGDLANRARRHLAVAGLEFAPGITIL